VHGTACCILGRQKHTLVLACRSRSAISEAAVNASLPGANLTDIMAALEMYYQMVMTAFPDDAASLQALYWTMINYAPPATAAASPAPQHTYPARGGGNTWNVLDAFV
jgi:hypothetical protein